MVSNTTLGCGDLQEGTGIGRWVDGLSPPQLIEKAKAVSQDDQLYVSAQVPLGLGDGDGIHRPPVPTLNFTGVYEVHKDSELYGKQD